MEALLLGMKTEWMVTAILLTVLLLRLGKGVAPSTLLSIVQLLLLVATALSVTGGATPPLFGGMYQPGPLAGFQKSVLLFAAWMVTLLFHDWQRGSEHLSEYLILMLSSLLGMCLMVSAGNLLMLYLSLELATIPMAAAANLDLGRKRSSEGAMKLILSSAFSSGVLLFGISLVYGTTGSLDFAGITAAVDGGGLQTLAFVFLFAAFAFKMSAVPFHLWTADVYQGSPMPVTAYLSVVSKGATAFVLVNLLHGLFAAMSDAWYRLLMVVVLATLVIGNLFALRQQDIKRFLAFSSIAQVGFILMGMTGNRPLGVSAITYFVLVYVFSNLAAFGVAALVSARTGAEDIPAYRGLAKSNPFLAWMMALALFSLAGIPPTAGFFAKMFLIVEGSWQGDYWFVVAAAINIAVSLYYYMRIVRLMFSEPERPMDAIVPAPSERLALLVCAAGIVLAGVLSWLYDHISTLI